MADLGLALRRSLIPARRNRTEASSPDERLRTLVEAQYDFVWRSVRRLGVSDADVDDAVQKVFLIFSQKIASVSEGSERSFLFQTALRVAADARRAMRRRREVASSDSDEPPDPAPGVEDLVDLRRARVRLDEILGSMSIDLRAVFVLFELEQTTLSEIAVLLDVPRGTVASRLRRAREYYESATRPSTRGRNGEGI